MNGKFYNDPLNLTNRAHIDITPGSAPMRDPTSASSITCNISIDDLQLEELHICHFNSMHVIFKLEQGISN